MAAERELDEDQCHRVAHQVSENLALVDEHAASLVDATMAAQSLLCRLGLPVLHACPTQSSFCRGLIREPLARCCDLVFGQHPGDYAISITQIGRASCRERV